MAELFRQGNIEGIVWRPLQKYQDPRGWLCELFRTDEILPEFHPVMAYISMTEPDVVRGPHEHHEQADFFCFIGPGNFKVVLWDNRPASATYRCRQTEIVGQDRPMAVIVPPGVVHAYQNVSTEPAWVFNCPNQLYRGPGRSQPVDEIRHELDPQSIFHME